MKTQNLLTILVVSFSVLLTTAAPNWAADAATTFPDSPTEKIYLWPDGAPGAKGEADADKPYITIALPIEESDHMGVVLFCPGGGYMHHSSGRVYRKEVLQAGYVFVRLSYRLPGRAGDGYNHPYPLRDAQRALSLLRSHAEAWGFNKDKIGVMGSSSGAHLASGLATHYELEEADVQDDVDQVSCKPDFVALFCPVITMKKPFAHTPSVVRLLGKDATEAMKKSMSSEEQVTAESPPAFLAQAEDDWVSIQNSKAYHDACVKHQVAVTYVTIDKSHGLSHGIEAKPEVWNAPLQKWLKSLQSTTTD